MDFSLVIIISVTTLSKGNRTKRTLQLFDCPHTKSGLFTLQLKCLRALDYLLWHNFIILTGLFNICDKVLVSLDIMLEFREYFRRGHPLANVIMSKMSVLRLKCREVCLSIWWIWSLCVSGCSNGNYCIVSPVKMSFGSDSMIDRLIAHSTCTLIVV